MLSLEEKLSIQVRHFYGVQINYGDVPKARKDDVLEQLTANATGADNQQTAARAGIHAG